METSYARTVNIWSSKQGAIGDKEVYDPVSFKKRLNISMIIYESAI